MPTSTPTPAGIVEAVARTLCRSGKFETGEGTCAPICMEFLGDPRKSGCGHACRVHEKLATAAIHATLLAAREASEEVVDAACQARNMVAGTHWTDGVTEGVQRIERMLAERAHTAMIDALITLIGKPNP